MAKDTTPKIRVVEKTEYNHLANKTASWFEVQYYSPVSECWRSYRNYNSPIRFKKKDEALDFCLRKKAGATHNQTTCKVVA